MLDFTPVRNKQLTIAELTANLTKEDLRTLTNGMVDRMLDMIAGCTDAQVVFVPQDTTANDTFATNPDETNLAWTLGHVIVHTTASSEENAFIAAELARGVAYHGRSRSEVHWTTITTIAQCRHRLEESRRMRLATLDVWPDTPYLDNFYQYSPEHPKQNPITYFCRGLMHDDSHLGQIEEIVRQASYL